MSTTKINQDGLLRNAIETISNQLCYAVKGEFDFTIESDCSDDSIQKLNMLVNFLVDAARRALYDVREKNKQLTELDKLKSDFMTNISHELRTPLTLIMGPLDIILKDAESPFVSQYKTELQRIQRNAARLYVLVNQLLDFSKVEAGKYEFHETTVDLNDLISQIIDDAQDSAKSNQLTLQYFGCSTLPPMLLDEYVIEKIILNLVINAIKFTPEKGHIEVHLESLDNHIHLTVKDTGIGIPKEQMGKLFERFHQLDASLTRKYEGTGIGLAFIHKLVKLMNGEIKVESAENKGSTFTVILPIKIPEGTEKTLNKPNKKTTTKTKNPFFVGYTQHKPATIAQKSDSLKPLILIADDNPDIRAYLISLLENEYNIIEAHNGEQALEAVREHHPTLVLSDVMMPIMDGFQLTRSIKSDSSIKHIPIILITAKAGKDALTSSFDIGANDYLSKPFSPDELIARTRAAIDAYQKQEKIMALNENLKKEIEERTRLEQENTEKAMLLAHAGRLTALGEMASGVAHELNQPLSIVRTNIQSLLYLAGDSLSKEITEIISSSIRQVDRASHIISHMRTFARNSEMAPLTAIDLAEPIESAISMFNEQFRLHNISIITSLEKSTPKTLIDPQHIEQIVVNLLSNSRYAVEKMCEKNNNAYKMEIKIDLQYIKEKRQFLLQVSDNGQGMTKKELDRCFDPFFTTKPVGEGTGLGLSIVHSMVQNFKGDITINSVPGKGTEVKLYLPVLRANEGAA